MFSGLIVKPNHQIRFKRNSSITRLKSISVPNVALPNTMNFLNSYEVLRSNYITPTSLVQYRNISSRSTLSSGKIETFAGENTSKKLAVLDNSNNINGKGDVSSDLIDVAIPEVTCEFVLELLRQRRERLVTYKRQQLDIFSKIFDYTLEKNDERGRKEQEVSSTNEADKEYTKLKNSSISSSSDTIRNSNEFNSITPEELRAVLTIDEHELFEKKIITRDEWETYSHAKPKYNDEYLIIDCRTVNQITSWGLIDGAKVVPAHEMFAAFKLDPAEFLQEYGFQKPDPAQKIILYCQFGPSSSTSGYILNYLGYTSFYIMRGGYYLWAKQYNSLLKRWAEEDRITENDRRRRAILEAANHLKRELPSVS